MESPATPPTPQVTQQIPLNQIVPSPSQARMVFDEQKLEQLAQTMKERGLENAILVRRVGDKYELIAGERRWRAARMLGWKTIEAKIRLADDREAILLGLVENLQREDLNPMEEAQGFAQLQSLDPKTWTHEAIANSLGLKRPYVTLSLGLLDLPSEVQQNVRQRTFSRTHAVTLLSLKTPQDQIELCKQSIAESWNVNQLEQAVKRRLGKGNKFTEAEAKKANEDRSIGPDPMGDRWETLSEKAQPYNWQADFQGPGNWRFDLFLLEGAPGDPQRLIGQAFLKMAFALGETQIDPKLEEAYAAPSRQAKKAAESFQSTVEELAKGGEIKNPMDLIMGAGAKMLEEALQKEQPVKPAPDKEMSAEEQIRWAREFAAKNGRIG